MFRLTKGRLLMTEVSQSKSRLLKTTSATMLVLLYSSTERGAPSGYMRRMVVWEPASLSKPRTGALFILETAEGEEVDQNPAGFFSVPLHVCFHCGLPNDDIIAVDVRSEVAPVKDPSAAHHHTAPASPPAAKGGRQA